MSIAFLAVEPGAARATRLELSYQLDERDVTVEYDERESSHRVTLRGEAAFAADGWGGAPLFPALHRTILLPPNTRVSRLTVLTSDPVVVAQDVVPDYIRGEDPGEGGESPDGRDPLYYESGVPFPPDPGFLTGNGSYRGLCLGDLAAMPFEWDSETRDLLFYRSIEIVVDYEPASDIPQRLRRDRRFSRKGFEIEFVRRRVVNPDALEAYLGARLDGMIGHGEQGLSVTESNPSTGFHPTDRPSLEGPSIDMVIITGTEWADGTDVAGDMVAAWQEAADWKTLTGTPTVVRTVQWIRESYPGHDDPARIRAFLRDAYEKWGTDFVLMGGDDKVVPARLVLKPSTNLNDYPTQWWYASLDYEPSEDDLGSYYPELAVDHYPELWVGRVPVRDEREVQDFVHKLKVYEHAPGEDRPSGDYYTSFLSAASFTNSGSMGSWSNGLRMSEAIVDSVFAPNDFTSTRLYPALPPDPVNCGSGQTLTCWEGVQDYFGGNYPSGRMTAQNIRDELNDGYAFFFHCEHSFFHQLGGPSRGNNGNIINEDVDCGAPCTDCGSWKATCLEQFVQLNPGLGFEREMAELLSNGPEYSVAVTYGSLTGRHEVDSIVERIVRAPGGGAICMAAKSVSLNSIATHDSTLVPFSFFHGIVRDRLPPGVSLQSALSKKQSILATRTWHFFGDPSMSAWTVEPGNLWISAPDSISAGGPRSILITVTDGVDPVPGAMVTVSRADDVFVVGQTGASGTVQFDAVPILHDNEKLVVWAKAENFIPASDSIRVNFLTNVNPFHPMVYEEHTWTDTGGQVSELLEAGEEVELTVKVTNLANQEVTGGSATIFATPRVRVTALRDLVLIPSDEIFIGANLAHPPAFADIFDLSINEQGIRPEGEPTGTLSDDAIYLWRGADGLYRLEARHGTGWNGSNFEISIWADGGIEAVADSCSLDGSDSYTESPGLIELKLVGDTTDPDLLVFRASGQDWVSWSDSTGSIPATDPGESADLDFGFDLDGRVPDHTRLGFTIVTHGTPFLPTFSDFYLSVSAPGLVLNGGSVEACPSCGGCVGCSGTTYQFRPAVRNLGSVKAEARVTIGSVTDATGVCNTSSGWFTLDAGKEVATGFTICDDFPPDFVVGSLSIEWRVNGVEYEAESWTDLAWNTRPGTVQDLHVDSTPGGLRSVWDPPSDTTGVQGYHVYLKQDLSTSKVTPRPIAKASAHVTDLYRFDALAGQIDWRIGVTSVRDDWSESAITWSDAAQYVVWEQRPGWPKRVPKGSVSSVVPFNIDQDDSLEVIAGGQVISIWKPSGASATGDPTGFLYEPPEGIAAFADSVPRFVGDLAVSMIDGDTLVAIAGSHADGNLYVVGKDGNLLFSPKPTRARATPTIANLDGSGAKEVIVQSWKGEVYAFRSDGSSYSNRSGSLLIDHTAPHNYTWNGVAVADAGEDHLVILQSTQNTGPCRLYAWEAEDAKTVDPAKLWTERTLTNANRTAAPVVADVDDDGELEIVVRTTRSYSTLETFDFLTGTPEKQWSWLDPLFGTGNSFVAGPYQPSVADLGGDSKLEIVFTGRADVSDFSTSTWVMVGYLKTDGAPAIVTGTDDILLPGRRESPKPTTVGSPLVCDFDGDGKMEILVASDQGGLFAFEADWNGAGTGSFTLTPEVDWPIVFAETPLSMAAADIDDDGMIELLVATDDGYVHLFDLPGAIVGWAMAGGDSERTGWIPLPATRGADPLVAQGSVASLRRVEPNPSGGETVISFQLPYPATVGVDVFDANGRRIRTLLDAALVAPGEHGVRWDGRDDRGRRAASGTYFVRVQLGERVMTRKIVRLQ